MKAHSGVYINVQPETAHQTQELVTYLETAHCTWHIDEDGCFIIYPVDTKSADTVLAEIQAL